MSTLNFIVCFALCMTGFILVMWGPYKSTKRLNESKQHLVDTLKECIEKRELLIQDSKDREINLIKSRRVFPWDVRFKEGLMAERKFQKELIESLKSDKEKLKALQEEN